MSLRNIFRSKKVSPINPLVPIIDMTKLREALNTKNIIKCQLKDDKYLASLNLQEAGTIMAILSGQQRSPLWEDWCILRGYFTSKVPSKLDRGDLSKNNRYYELKTAMLDLEGKEKNTVFRGNQIRLWQKLDAYIFITTNEATGATKMYFIPAGALKNHYINGTVSYSSSHIVGGSKNKSIAILNVNNRQEWGISMHRDKFDWTIYEVVESQLIEKLK